MAIFNVSKINDYIKFAGAGEFCITCAKKKNAEDPNKDFYDIKRELTGKIENKMVLNIRTSGVDQCVCMDCIKEIYDKYIAPTLETTNTTEGENK